MYSAVYVMILILTNTPVVDFVHCQIYILYIFYIFENTRKIVLFIILSFIYFYYIL